MATVTSRTRMSVIPCLRYRDAPAAIDWLCRAFGFERHLVVPGENGTIAHAQLVLGDGMIMLGSTEAASGGTQEVCCVVVDPDAIHAQSLAMGAVITADLKEEHFGGRSFTCQDPEGYVWTFGNYDPWQAG